MVKPNGKEMSFFVQLQAHTQELRQQSPIKQLTEAKALSKP